MIRRLLRLVLRPVLALAALLWIPFALLGIVDLDDTWHGFPSLLAFLPYVAVGTAFVVVLCVLLRARIFGTIALVGLVVLVAPRAGRFTSDPQPTAHGDRIVLATANLLLGRASVTDLERLVDHEHIDVLALQEITPEFTRSLAASGIASRLSYSVREPGPGSTGISLYSRWPITPVAARGRDRRSVGGILQLADGPAIAVRSAHPSPPFAADSMHRWNAYTRAIATTTRATPVRTILAGDFNATLDHHSLRHLMAGAQLRDAAEQTGMAWRPTWSNGRWGTLTLDHVLVPPRVAIEAIAFHDLPGSDHDLVVTTLRLPA